MRHPACRTLGGLAALCAGLAVLVCVPEPARAWVYHDAVPNRYGVALAAGDSYSPDGVSFVEISGCALFDYDRVWNHPAPGPLRFKVEGGAGIAAFEEKPGVLVSVRMVALHYLGDRARAGVRPYAEAGIGVIYTDFQVEGQGLRLNFNPLVGAGVEFETASAGSWFAAVRLHHVSNGDLDHENRGINSLLLMVGRYY